MLPKLNSAHGSETRNIINRAIEVLNQQGKTIQDLVAEGQLTEGQYAELISAINQHVKSGDIDKFDLTPQLRSEIYKIIEIESNLSSGININDFDEPTRQAFLEAQGIDVNYVLGPRNVGNINLKEDAITPETVGFINKPTNLFNEKTQIVGQSIDGVTGEWAESASTNTSELIRVKPNTTYSTMAFNAAIYFDDSGEYDRKRWIGPGADTFETRANTHFVRVQYQSSISYKPQLNEGPELLPYEPYRLHLSDAFKFIFGSESLKEKSVSWDKTDFIKKSTNLFDWDKVQYNSLINTEGEIVDGEDGKFAIHHKIKVEPGSPLYTVGPFVTIIYDQDGEMIRRYSVDSSGHYMQLDDNVHYVAFNLQPNSSNVREGVSQINISDTKLPYEDYYLTIDNFKVSANNVSDLDKAMDDVVKPAMDIAPDKVFSTDEPYLSVPSFGDLQANEIYQIFDGLMAEHPDYITRELYGDDGHGNDVYLYKASPPRVDATTNGRRPKVFLLSGVHGHERIPIMANFLMLKQMCERWSDDEMLEALRFNVDFLIMPVANPSGRNASTRKNANGVDINSNFPEGWEHGESEPGDRLYRGPEPMSEAESQYISQVLDDHPDIDIMYDCHSFWGSEDRDNNLWVPTASDKTQALAQLFISTMTRKWRKEYDFVPQDPAWFAGYTNYRWTGTPQNHFYTRGVKRSGIYEFSDFWRVDPNGESYDEIHRITATEAIVNWVLINLEDLTK